METCASGVLSGLDTMLRFASSNEHGRHMEGVLDCAPLGSEIGLGGLQVPGRASDGRASLAVKEKMRQTDKMGAIAGGGGLLWSVDVRGCGALVRE